MRQMDKKEIFGMGLSELQSLFIDKGLKKYRADQVFDWLYKKSVFTFSEMKNIARSDAELMNDNFTVLPANVKILRRQQSADGLTTKDLVELTDGNTVETVSMKHDYGCSICVSSQVGCNMGCAFCASGIGGFVRNLSPQEILLQIALSNQLLVPAGGRISRIVVMGSGEPLLNLDAVLEALTFAHREDAFNISCRNMTVSTCGIVPGIDALAGKGIRLNLAISLHAANNDLRSELMPVNDTYVLTEVIAAAERYARTSGRQVTYEYILIAGKNDSLTDAELLANALRFKHASVNLIPVNPVEEKGYRRPSTERIDAFLRFLQKRKINVTIRKEMGKDIDAACGQLRSKAMKR